MYGACAEPARTSVSSSNLAPERGFEPRTLRLTAACSTVELLRNGSVDFRWCPSETVPARDRRVGCGEAELNQPRRLKHQSSKGDSAVKTFDRLATAASRELRAARP